MNFVLGIDLGTSYFKLGLFDREGNLCGMGRVEVTKDIPSDGYCELPVDRFWNLLNDGLKQACKQAGALPSDIVGIGYSSQANSFLLLDEKNNALTPIIIWTDKRANVYSEVKELFADPDFIKTTGLGVKPNETLCMNKVLWFQENYPAIWEKSEHIMTISDYLIFSLTGEKVSDAGSSSLLGMTDVENCRWWNTALNTVGIKEKQLSKLYKPATITGKVNKEFNQLEGLKAGIPVTAGSLDHHIAALGAGAGTIADVSESTGTVLACLSLTDKFKPEPEIITGKGISDTFWKLAFDNNGAGNLDWYVKNYASGFSFEDLTKQAAKIPAGSEGLVALPCSSEYEGLEGFVNKKSFHTEAHYFRALLESSAYTLKQLIEKLYPENTPDKVVATGGGSKNDLWLQIKADMLKAEFIVTNCVEPACRGAAMFAAKGCGWYENIQKVSENWIKVNKTFRPDHKVQEEYNHWFKELDKT